MLVAETIAQICRLALMQGMPIKAICQELGISRKVVRKVQAHRIDCAFIAIAADDGWRALDALETIPVFREQLVLLVPKGHRAVRAPTDVEPKAPAAFASGCTYRMLAEEWRKRLLAASNIEP